MSADHHQKHDDHSKHHILEPKTAFLTLTALLVLTGITVLVARFDFGAGNLFVALLVATIKALLVALVFMGLAHDKRENGVIFATSFLFLIIFIVLASTDTFFRGDVYVKGEFLKPAASSGPKFTRPWVSSPELVARGKELYSQVCATCHGAEGYGNGPGSGTPVKPRNFHAREGWKNGRKPTQIYKTLTYGIAPYMAAYKGQIEPEDMLALAHYVRTFGDASADADSAADLAQAKIDTTRPDGGLAGEVKRTIPVDVALALSTEPSNDSTSSRSLQAVPVRFRALAGHSLYQAACVQCHGAQGEGMKTNLNLGAYAPTRAYVQAKPLSLSLASLQSQDAFNRIVRAGLPGRSMPSMGSLSEQELKELYQYSRALAESR